MTDSAQNAAPVSEHAKALLCDSIACDMTLPWGPDNENKEQTLPRFAAAGFGFVSLTIGMDWISLDRTMRAIGAEKARLRRQPEKYLFASSVADIRRARQEGKLALGFHLQGTNGLERDTNLVRIFNRLGVRQFLLAYNEKNHVGDGCHERTDAGLSRYGVRLIKEMNRVGVIVDCTHTGYRTTMDAMEISTAPCIFSHSNARALMDHERNIRDEQIKACAATGGVIGINGVGMFLAHNDASPAIVANHIDYIAQLVGPQHVALGFDLVYYMDSMIARWRANQDRYPKGYPAPPWHFFQPEDLPALVDELLARNYDDATVRGILGENYLRVAGQVWQ